MSLKLSVVTPTFNTPAQVLARTWASLRRQTYSLWDWVVWDDSTTDDVWRQVYGFCADDRYVIGLHRSHQHSGVIGHVKRKAFGVADGDVLVELDHDDELTPDALERIADAFQDPSVGFVYSDWCEINDKGQSCRYPSGWAFGYGSDYWDADHGVWAMRAPELNRTTIGHIVSAPNHVRAWRASVYHAVGGHGPLPVADDYDLVVRTVLGTDWKYIPKMLYTQHIGPSTAQRTRNDMIQTLVPAIEFEYRTQLNERFNHGTTP